MPVVLTTELGDEFFGLESDVCARVHVLLVQPLIANRRHALYLEVLSNTKHFSSTHFFTLPGQNSFQGMVSSVTHVCTDCQNICSGRFGGNLRTTILRPKAFRSATLRLSLALFLSFRSRLGFLGRLFEPRMPGPLDIQMIPPLHHFDSARFLSCPLLPLYFCLRSAAISGVIPWIYIKNILSSSIVSSRPLLLVGVWRFRSPGGL